MGITGMVVWGVKWGDLTYESKSTGHINPPAVETTFGGNENRRQRKFLSEQGNKMQGIEKCKFP